MQGHVIEVLCHILIFAMMLQAADEDMQIDSTETKILEESSDFLLQSSVIFTPSCK
jgi:hypothetical protein